MKNFRITTVKWDNERYTELYCEHASEVVELIKSHKVFQELGYEIAHKSPIDGTYGTSSYVVKFDAEKNVVQFNNIFKIPSAFKKLI